MGVIVKVPGTRYSTYGKDAFTKAASLSIGSWIADGIIHDPIFGRLLNWLFLACYLVTFIVFWPVWIIIWAYCYFAHYKGTMEAFDLLKHLAFGKP